MFVFEDNLLMYYRRVMVVLDVGVPEWEVSATPQQPFGAKINQNTHNSSNLG